MKKFVLAISCAGVALAPGAALGQTSGVRLHDVYYSDASHTEVIVYCDNSTFQWGSPSGYPVNVANNDC